MLPQLTRYRADIETAMKLSLENAGNGKLAMESADGLYQALARNIGALVEVEKKLASDSSARMADEFRTTLGVLVAIVLLAVLLSLNALAIFLRQRLRRRLRW